MTSDYGNWEQAEAEAIAAGGHLVTINDDAENSWISTFIFDKNCYPRTYQGFDANIAWIGYRHDGSSWGWASGEPSPIYKPSPLWTSDSGSHAYMHGDFTGVPGTWRHAEDHNSNPAFQPLGVIEVPYEVPEPSSVIVWSSLGAAGAVIALRRRLRRKAA